MADTLNIYRQLILHAWINTGRHICLPLQVYHIVAVYTKYLVVHFGYQWGEPFYSILDFCSIHSLISQIFYSLDYIKKKLPLAYFIQRNASWLILQKIYHITKDIVDMTYTIICIHSCLILLFAGEIHAREQHANSTRKGPKLVSGLESRTQSCPKICHNLSKETENRSMTWDTNTKGSFNLFR